MLGNGLLLECLVDALLLQRAAHLLGDHAGRDQRRDAVALDDFDDVVGKRDGVVGALTDGVTRLEERAPRMPSAASASEALPLLPRRLTSCS